MSHMKRWRFPSLGTLALLFFQALETCAATGGGLFKDGETVCFLGDSITARGSTQTIIADYYLTRFPERTIRFVNAGRSGDSAGGALGRLQDDVIAKKPTSVTIMLGMNDVGRGSYVAHPDAGKLKQQQQSLNSYKANMEKVVARIRAEAGEPRLLFITPSPFDQTVVLEKENNQPGCNDGLGRCAEIVKELAVKNQAAVVDFHGPMTALNLEQQKKDPKWTIVGGDRVHPGAPGHLMMAWLFLKAQGASAIVSKVTVDAAAGRAAENVNAEVTGVEKKDGGVAFTVLEKALPFPTDPAAKPVLEILPIEKELNQEMLAVSGLAKGPYELKIDGVVVAKGSAEDFAHGINLAFNEATPQFKQAQRVARLNEQRRSAESQACSLMNTRRWMQSHYKVNVDDPAAVQAHYDRFTDKKEYNAGMALNYIKNWSKYGDLLKQVTAHEKDALSVRTPVPHTYAVVPVAASGKEK
jgi:lysophospholipase L1-like esterase